MENNKRNVENVFSTLFHMTNYVFIFTYCNLN